MNLREDIVLYLPVLKQTTNPEATISNDTVWQLKPHFVSISANWKLLC